jgi:hypothetical protein
MKGQSLDARRLGFKLGQHSLTKYNLSHARWRFLGRQSLVGYTVSSVEAVCCGGRHNDLQRYQTRIYIFRIFKNHCHQSNSNVPSMHRARASTKPSVATGVLLLLLLLLLRYPCHTSSGCSRRRRRRRRRGVCCR